MPKNELYVLIFLLIAWIALNVIATMRILRMNSISKSNRKVKLLFTWVIPFFWALFIIVFTSKPSKRTVDKKNRYREAGYKNYTRYR